MPAQHIFTNAHWFDPHWFQHATILRHHILSFPLRQVSLCDYRPWDRAVQTHTLWQLGADAGNSYFALRASGSGSSLYLGVCKERVEEGAQVVAQDWRGTLHQMWGFQPVVRNLRPRYNKRKFWFWTKI